MIFLAPRSSVIGIKNEKVGNNLANPSRLSLFILAVTPPPHLDTFSELQVDDDNDDDESSCCCC